MVKKQRGTERERETDRRTDRRTEKERERRGLREMLSIKGKFVSNLHRVGKILG